MVVKSGQVEYRLIRRWFAEEKRFCLWMTNLPRAAWSAEQVMSLYRCLAGGVASVRFRTAGLQSYSMKCADIFLTLVLVPLSLNPRYGSCPPRPGSALSKLKYEQSKQEKIDHDSHSPVTTQ